MPVDRLLRRMNDRELPEEYRDELARAVAPTAPRLSAVSVTKRPAEMTDEEIAPVDRYDQRRNDRWPRRLHLKALLEALEGEQARRRKAQLGGHDDPRGGSSKRFGKWRIGSRWRQPRPPSGDRRYVGRREARLSLLPAGQAAAGRVGNRRRNLGRIRLAIGQAGRQVEGAAHRMRRTGAPAST
jgi:hypothetical protein